MPLTIFITQMAGGGMERFAATVCNALVEKGREVRICSLHPPPESANSTGWLDARVPHRVLNRSAKGSVLALRRVCREHPRDPVLALSLEIAVVLVILKKLRLIRNPVLYRESTAVLAHNSARWRWGVRHVISKTDGLVLQTHQGLEDLRLLFEPRQPVLHLRNPCRLLGKEITRSCPACQGPSLPKLLVMGRMEKMKGHARMLRAMSNVLPRIPGARLVFVGTGSLESMLRESASALGLKDAVVFEGFQPDPLPFYLAADILVLPSDYEGMPNVIPEALASGCRVLAADGAGGIRELMEDLGLSEYLVPLGDFERSFSSFLDKVIASPEEIWEQARSKLKEQMDPTKAADEIWEWLTEHGHSCPC